MWVEKENYSLILYNSASFSNRRQHFSSFERHTFLAECYIFLVRTLYLPRSSPQTHSARCCHTPSDIVFHALKILFQNEWTCVTWGVMRGGGAFSIKHRMVLIFNSRIPTLPYHFHPLQRLIRYSTALIVSWLPFHVTPAVARPLRICTVHFISSQSGYRLRYQYYKLSYSWVFYGWSCLSCVVVHRPVNICKTARLDKVHMSSNFLSLR
jgi:hypothetical protein